MLGGLILFLVGALVLVVVVYIAKLILDLLALPGPVKQIALLIIGLVGLIALILLCYRAFFGGGTPIIL